MKNLMMRIALLLACVYIPQWLVGQGGEGMWVPFKAIKENAAELKATGLRLKPAQLYDEAKPTVEDAVVKLNGGSCTAEAVSAQGLLFTNHHCAYDAIAGLSTVAHDYLTEGFWAMKMEDELPIPGATAAFLLQARDVTAEITAAGNAADAKIEALETAAAQGGAYLAEVVPMYAGNEYYLFVYEVYRDVRLVGAPPSSIGKFGGDTDNWMWPRHTCDFSMLRVYANAENRPAAYSPENKPYRPKHFLPVSLAPVNEGDYTMVMGYPGSTERYLTAAEMDAALNGTNADYIKLFGIRTRAMKAEMDRDDAVRIALAGDYASLMNTYKYFIGQTEMLRRHKVVDKRRAEEAKFTAWANAEAGRKAEYGSVVGQIAQNVVASKDLTRYSTYFQVGLLGCKSLLFATQFFRMKDGADSPEKLAPALRALEGRLERQFAEYNAGADRETFAQMLRAFYEDVPPGLHPPAFQTVLDAAPGEGTPGERLLRWGYGAFDQSFITSRAKVEAFIANPAPAALQSDPLIGLAQALFDHYRGGPGIQAAISGNELGELHRAYIRGLRKMSPEKKFYPDANSSLRLSYGRVKSYFPRDGVYYKHYTTIEGVLEKENPAVAEFQVPARLKELALKRDFGRYGNGYELRTCFLTTNDITGGNSGSPVLNARGELVGIAFDGNWEAMAGDLVVFPQYNRTIVVDIHYVLFIVDKFAGCTRLVEEMKIVE